MNANANIVDRVERKSTLVRPRFSPGLLLRDDDLRVGVDYTRELSRLLFRSLFGCGVVCGLKVTPEFACKKLKVTVDKGVALNCIGDPINVPEPVEIVVDPSCGKEIPTELWVTLCRTENCCAPRTAVCGCEEEDSASVCTREQDGFEIRLLKEINEGCSCSCKPKELPSNKEQKDDDPSNCWCARPCDDCYRPHYSATCGCECCDGDCVVLAFLTRVEGQDNQTNQEDFEWVANHSVRRFVRPVLVRDPVVYSEQYPGEVLCATPDVTGNMQATGEASAIKETAKKANQVTELAMLKSAEVRKAVAAGKIDDAEVAAKLMVEAASKADAYADELATQVYTAATNAKEEVATANSELETARKRMAAEITARKTAAKKAATTTKKA